MSLSILKCVLGVIGAFRTFYLTWSKLCLPVKYSISLSFILNSYFVASESKFDTLYWILGTSVFTEPRAENFCDVSIVDLKFGISSELETTL
jgi:hypothetical protein